MNQEPYAQILRSTLEVVTEAEERAVSCAAATARVYASVEEERVADLAAAALRAACETVGISCEFTHVPVSCILSHNASHGRELLSAATAVTAAARSSLSHECSAALHILLLFE